MNDEPAAPPAGEGVFELPRDTTPTWEVELLLSGALVFSMLQVPGWLDQAIQMVQPRLTGSLHYGAFMLYFYLKITSYALICTFVLHLSSRAIWVGALGLRSVYPEGIDWARLKRGPIYRSYATESVDTLTRTIERADNRASKVFAFGLVLVLMSLAIMVFTMSLVALSALIGWYWPNFDDSTWVTFGLVGLFVLPVIAGSLIDRHYGERIAPGGRLARAILASYRFSSWMVWGRITSPFLLTVMSRLGVGRGNLLMLGALYGLMGVVLLELLLRNGVLQLPGEQLLPASAPGQEMRAAWYADQRSIDDTLRGEPFIASALSTGPYLRVFVPWLERRVAGPVRRDCPAAAEPIASTPDKAARKAATAARTAALLACAGEHFHPLALDGQPLAADYQLGEDARSGLRGFVAMLPVAGLSSGRHELSIGRPAREGEMEARDPVLIPFWR